MKRLLVACLLATLTGCSESEGATQTAEDVAADIGCTEVRQTGNLADLDEVTCTLNREEVTVTDWSKLSDEDKRGFLEASVSMGYQVIEVTDDITVGTESMPVAKQVHDKIGGDWIGAG